LNCLQGEHHERDRIVRRQSHRGLQGRRGCQRHRRLDAWGVWSYEGGAAWQVAVEGWFASHPADRLKVSFDDVDTVIHPAFACVTAIVTYAIVSTQGEPMNEMQNRITWVLKTSGHVRRIVHEHTSVPVGFEDQKAILKRQNKT
jgi:hypothetical protein